MSSMDQEATADILKIPRVFVPGKQESFPFDIASENTVEEETDRLLDRLDIKDDVDDYEMRLTYRDETNSWITITLDPEKDFTFYDSCFQLIVNGMPDVTIHLVAKSDQETSLQNAIKKK